MSGGEVLEGGGANRGSVVRIGDRVHRPRRKGADVAEALLVHLESVGYEGAPRFFGHDEEGRQVLSFVEGDVYPDQRPPWIDDDAENARMLGRFARFLGELHAATAGFVSPVSAEPFRPLPLAGDVWNHADAHYGNLVLRRDDPVALIDWECCAPGDRIYDPSTLLLNARCPRPDDPDNARRARAAASAVEAILDGYAATDDERGMFDESVATVFDDVADFIADEDITGAFTPEARTRGPARLRWQAEWWRRRQQ